MYCPSTLRANLPEDSYRLLASGPHHHVGHFPWQRHSKSHIISCSSLLLIGKVVSWLGPVNHSYAPISLARGRTQENAAAGDGCQIQTFPRAFQNIPKIRHLEFQEPRSLSTLSESPTRIDSAEERKLASKRRDFSPLLGRRVSGRGRLISESTSMAMDSFLCYSSESIVFSRNSGLSLRLETIRVSHRL